MLDINEIRENPDEVRENLRKRNDPKAMELLNDVLKHDEEWRKLKQHLDELRHQRNVISERINKAKKEGEDAKQLIQDAKTIAASTSQAEEQVEILQEKIKDHLMRIPNILHESVPEGKTEEENKVLEEKGKKPAFKFQVKNHVDILEEKKWADFERAAKISGSRWYFLKGELARLEQALTSYALQFMTKKGFTMVIPPFALNREAYEGVLDLAGFEEAIYKIHNEDLMLIATSEHPLTAQYKDEVFNVKELPIKLVGYSTCFRKEAGAHGREEKGIFRVHQFNKVEQIIIAKPEESWKFHEDLVNNASEFLDSLGLHHRKVLLCSGDTGDVAAKTVDLEVWFPSQNTFREIGSESNCTSYQARRLNIKCEDEPGKNRRVLHTLNGTCIPTSRALAAIIENFQQEDGTVTVPEVLRPFFGKDLVE